MRALNDQEKAYLAENDPFSLSRIPVITPCFDSGDYRFDRDQKLTIKKDIDYGDIIHRVQNCIPEQKDALAITMLSAMGSIIGVAVNEYDWDQEDYPVSLQDISRVVALSGADQVLFVFNHTDYHEPQVRSIFSAAKRINMDVPMDDARLIAMYNCIGMGPRVNNVVTINLKEDTSTAILHEKNNAFFMVSIRGDKKGSFHAANEEIKQIWGLDAIDKQHFLDPDLTFDYTLGGKLKGVDKPHMERWKFYTSKDQTRPICYEDWKRKEIAWSAELLVDTDHSAPAPHIYTPEIKTLPQIIFTENDLPPEEQKDDMPVFEFGDNDDRDYE